MSSEIITIPTHGERLYSITSAVQDAFKKLLQPCGPQASGVLHLFVMHTSCALLISESYDPSARKDMERFFQYIVPRDLSFIEHTLEGPDDSPSHMKSALLQQHIACLVEKGGLILGTWQGIFLAEFRDAPHQRTVRLKFQADPIAYQGDRRTR